MNKGIKKVKNFDELITLKYGKIGTKKRDTFEEKAQYFVISEMLKEARHEAHLTQEELADKVGTKKVISPALKMGSAIFNYQHYTGYLRKGWVGISALLLHKYTVCAWQMPCIYKAILVGCKMGGRPHPLIPRLD